MRLVQPFTVRSPVVASCIGGGTRAAWYAQFMNVDEMVESVRTMANDVAREGETVDVVFGHSMDFPGYRCVVSWRSPNGETTLGWGGVNVPDMMSWMHAGMTARRMQISAERKKAEQEPSS